MFELKEKPKHFGVKILVLYLMVFIFAPLLGGILKPIMGTGLLASNFVSYLMAILLIVGGLYWLKLPLFRRAQNIKVGLIAVFLMVVVNVLDMGPWPGFSLSRLFQAIFLGFGASIMEEVAFRGPLFFWILTKAPQNMSKSWWTAIVSSILFGAFHLMNIGTTGNVSQSFIQAGYTMALGFGAAAIFLTTQNLLFTIAMHGLYDAIAFYTNLSGVSNVGGSTWSWIAMIIMVIVHLSVGVVLLNRLAKKV